jgi:hypothetical protein
LGDFWGDFLLSLGDFFTKTSGHPGCCHSQVAICCGRKNIYIIGRIFRLDFLEDQANYRMPQIQAWTKFYASKWWGLDFLHTYKKFLYTF